MTESEAKKQRRKEQSKYMLDFFMDEIARVRHCRKVTSREVKDATISS